MRPANLIDVSRENPYLTIWTRPRTTIRAIVSTDPAFRVLPIAMIGGVLQVIQLESALFAGNLFSVPILVALALVLGPALGLILLYAGAWIVLLSCRILGGQAESREVRAALAWSSVPFLATLPIWIFRLLVLGKELFTFHRPNLDSHPTLAYLLVASFFPELVLQIWWLVLTVKALGEVQRFSAWRALSSMLLLLPLFVVLIVVVVAIAAYFLFSNLLT